MLYMPEIDPQRNETILKGEPGFFQFREGIGNARVLNVLHYIQRQGLSDARSTHQLFSLFQPQEIEEDQYGIIDKDAVEPTSLWEQVAIAESNRRQLSIDQKSALDTLAYFALDSLANDPHERTMKGGEIRQLSEEVKNTAQTIVSEYGEHLKETFDPENAASASFFDIAEKIGNKTTRGSILVAQALALTACGLAMNDPLPATSTVDALKLPTASAHITPSIEHTSQTSEEKKYELELGGHTVEPINESVYNVEFADADDAKVAQAIRLLTAQGIDVGKLKYLVRDMGFDMGSSKDALKRSNLTTVVAYDGTAVKRWTLWKLNPNGTIGFFTKEEPIGNDSDALLIEMQRTDQPGRTSVDYDGAPIFQFNRALGEWLMQPLPQSGEKATSDKTGVLRINGNGKGDGKYSFEPFFYWSPEVFLK